MKKFKKIFAILLCAALLFSTVAMGVSADKNVNTLLVKVLTDKTNYSATDSARVTVKVENKSDKTLSGEVISAKADNWLLAKGSASNVLEVGEMNTGETKEISFNCVVNRSASGINFFNRIILFFKQLFNKPSAFKSINYSDKISVVVSKSVNHGGATVKITGTVWYAPVVTEPDDPGDPDEPDEPVHEGDIIAFGSYPQTDVTASMG